MEQGWIKVYTSNESFAAELVQAVLKDHEFNPVLINKRDSSYLNFCAFEIYVHQDFEKESLQIILENQL
jgi:hypothetical protein